MDHLDIAFRDLQGVNSKFLFRAREIATSINVVGPAGAYSVLSARAQLRSLSRTLIQQYSGITIGLSKWAFTYEMSDVMEGALQHLDTELHRKMQILAEGQSKFMNRRVSLERSMVEVAQEAKKATLNRYFEVRSTRRGATYRTGPDDQRLHGALVEALSAADWIVATPTGVGFGNSSILDAKAAHWHRMNFGAGAAGHSTRPRAYPAFFNLDPISQGEKGYHIGSLRLQSGPSPAFAIPAGVFLGEDDTIVPFGAGRGQPFYTRKMYLDRFVHNRHTRQVFLEHFTSPFVGRHKRGGSSTALQRSKKISDAAARENFILRRVGPKSFYTKGIVGYQFMDAGVKVIAKRVPDAYAKFFNQAFHDAAQAVPRGPLAGLT